MGTIVKRNNQTPGIVRPIPVSGMLKYEQMYISELLKENLPYKVKKSKM